MAVYGAAKDVGYSIGPFVEHSNCTHTMEIIICMVSFNVRFHRTGLMIRRRSRILRGGKAISAYLRKGVAAEPL